jgi:rfaE bifunctional protein nucleotidyltransferase chain/domain
MIFDWTAAQKLAEDCRARGGKVITTNGCFDILHVGHVSYLKAARQLGDLLLVGLNSDASVKKIKGPSRPINSETARSEVISALKSVDGACVFTEDTPIEWLRHIKPDIHVKGGDWDVAKMPETPVLAEWGGKVQTLPFIEGFSTTLIIDKMQGKT